MNRLEAFAADAVTGLTSGGSNTIQNPINIARSSYEIARALEAIFLAVEGAKDGGRVEIHVQSSVPMSLPQQQPTAYQQPQGSGVLGPNMPALSGQGGGSSMAFPPMPSPSDGQAMQAMSPGQVDVSPQPGGSDYTDPDPNTLPNREAAFWRKRMPRLPYRPDPNDSSVHANKARTARTISISVYKDSNPQWKGEYMTEVGEPPPEAMVI